jgi:homoserine O-acetyltransferase
VKSFIAQVILFIFSLPVFALNELVEKKEFTLGRYETVSGATIPNVKVGYETYGKLNAEKSNTILIAHYFTGNSHAAGKYTEADKAPGYWDAVIGPGKPFDTEKYFIISSDTLVNLSPLDPKTITTGPATLNPKTKKPWGMSFPIVGVRDFVQVQKKLLESLGITKLFAVAGASGGAAQALTWSAMYPQSVPRVVAAIGPGFSLPPYTIALLNLWSAPIKLDPAWKNGSYGNKPPLKGMTEALKILTHSSLSFGWGEDMGGGYEKPDQDPLRAWNHKYAIEAILHGRAEGRAAMLDPNSLLYMARAIQTYNVEKDVPKIEADLLFLPASSDMIFPAELSLKAAQSFCEQKKRAALKVIEGKGGHLDGIFKIQDAAEDITAFLHGKTKFCQF